MAWVIIGDTRVVMHGSIWVIIDGFPDPVPVGDEELDYSPRRTNVQEGIYAMAAEEGITILELLAATDVLVLEEAIDTLVLEDGTYTLEIEEGIYTLIIEAEIPV
jgi:hypothetical protein